MMTNRIESLIALAVGNANENESRNAAMLACKLMVENKVRLVAVGGQVYDNTPKASKVNGEKVYLNYCKAIRDAGISREVYNKAMIANLWVGATIAEMKAYL
jgi:hypothetical protein